MKHHLLTKERIPAPESDIVYKVKNERINRGSKNYRQYLIDSYGKERAEQMLRSRSQKN